MDDLLRFAATTGELRQIVKAFDTLGIEHGNVLFTVRDGSPWLEADVVLTPESADALEALDPIQWGTIAHAIRYGMLVRLTLWRRTGAVYRLREDGTVGDDPIPGCEGTLND